MIKFAVLEHGYSLAIVACRWFIAARVIAGLIVFVSIYSLFICKQGRHAGQRQIALDRFPISRRMGHTRVGNMLVFYNREKSVLSALKAEVGSHCPF